MKLKIFILLLLTVFVGAHCNVPLQAQETLPDTVWTKSFKNPIDINCVIFSPDGLYIFAGTNNVILQIETATGNIFRTLPGHTDVVANIGFSPSGDTIISMGADRIIRLWNYHTGDSIYTLNYFIPDSLDINLGPMALITPDGNRIVSLTSSWGDFNYNPVFIFDIHTKELIFSTGYSSSVNLLALTPDGKYFAISSYPKTIELYDLNTYQLIKKLGSHDEPVMDLAFSPDSKMVASCAMDGKVFVWDVETRELIHTFSQGQYHRINNLVFSNDSKFIIWGDGAGTDFKTQVWNIQSEERVYQYPYSSFGDLDIRNDGSLIAASSSRLYLLNPKWGVTKVEEPGPETEIIIFPNPITNIVNIEFNNLNSENVQIDILGINGNNLGNIFSGHLEAGNQIIPYNCSALANGTYLIRITSPTFTKTIKLVKEG